MATSERFKPPAPMLVFGYGNPSRGDDAIGPLVVQRLDEIRGQGGLPGVDLLTDFQLQVEHALDLCGREHVIFVDAALDQAEPLRWLEVQAAADAAWTSHSLSPAAVVGVYRALHGPPPVVQLLAVRGESFALGDSLSAAAERHLGLAVDALLAVLRGPGGE